MKRFAASKLGLVIMVEIHNSRIYMKIEDQMIRGAFKQLLSKKMAKLPMTQGKWDVYEIEGKTEDEIEIESKKMFEEGGFSIA